MIEHYRAAAWRFLMAGAVAWLALMPVRSGALADPVGAATLVESIAERAPETGDWQTLVIADSVFMADRVRADDNGSMRLTFLDETHLTIGPGGSVVIDQFVYDPATGAGALSAEMGVGIFRFASGALPSEAITITTPTALLGVRGTEFDVVVDGQGRTIVRVIEGEVTLSSLLGGEFQTVLADQAAYVDGALDRSIQLIEAGEWSVILRELGLADVVEQTIPVLRADALRAWDEVAGVEDTIALAQTQAGKAFRAMQGDLADAAQQIEDGANLATQQVEDAGAEVAQALARLRVLGLAVETLGGPSLPDLSDLGVPGLGAEGAAVLDALGIEVPGMGVPGLGVPDVELPDIGLPSIELPSLDF